jgi:hypothetical protein
MYDEPVWRAELRELVATLEDFAEHVKPQPAPRNHRPPDIMRDIAINRLEAVYRAAHDRAGVPVPVTEQTARFTPADAAFCRFARLALVPPPDPKTVEGALKTRCVFGPDGYFRVA